MICETFHDMNHKTFVVSTVRCGSMGGYENRYSRLQSGPKLLSRRKQEITLRFFGYENRYSWTQKRHENQYFRDGINKKKIFFLNVYKHCAFFIESSQTDYSDLILNFTIEKK